MSVQPKIPDLAELVIIKDDDALAIFTKAGDIPGQHAGLDPLLAHVRKHIEAFEGDVSTEAGRKRIASMAFAVTKSKTALESVGERLAKEQKELPKKIDAGRRYAKETLDEWRDQVRKPLTDWEKAEEDRVNRHAKELDALKALALAPPGSVEEVRERISQAEAVSDGLDREEFQDGFRLAKSATLANLREKLAWRENYDAEQVELARLRAANEAREAQDRARRETEEAVRREEEQKAAIAQAAADAERREREAAEKRMQDERDAAARREAELTAAAEAAEARAREAKERAQAELEAQQAEERRQTALREQNRAHRATVNRAALDALVAGGVPEEHAKAALVLIIGGAVPAVSINY